MSKYKLDAKTLTLLKAQAKLTETFNHTIRSAKSGALPFRLKVEHASMETQFRVEVGSQCHSLTLPNNPKMHLQLAAFIEEIANGPLDLGTSATKRSDGKYNVLDEQLSLQVFDLVRRGGMLSLDVGLEQPIHVSIHRNRTRTAATTLMTIGVRQPRTKCFTLSGPDAEIHEKVVESINHLASIATPAMQAA
ncbi:hypothetical protein A584_16760 [Pseudomonas syringae pv. theae ICMP 3923]|uniref:Uncharacterized protein n=1 Tax=Pseudomonas syringae pv. theae TaxID=103985 RepID=A0A0N8TK74_PSESX|nr:hypothetical protein [Pseudomonas syringae]EPM68800.1 hypothetical protein A584_16760 [Pseudomonas syringae pv. theae ICMP 3923]KPZ32401.1 hypothetical protein AN901_200201 [Pseudomonas syringae pv. theae]MBL3872344.1 hypothetical protein [Pseudomonas syringae pv. theae]RMT67272.1 hypothetical protein ALP44_03483 [Pseudomonas syringae pv. theae]GKQ30301.1 hypothetical protein PSTH68_12300 [Pseudomonas syringae pv. theae]